MSTNPDWDGKMREQARAPKAGPVGFSSARLGYVPWPLCDFDRQQVLREFVEGLSDEQIGTAFGVQCYAHGEPCDASIWVDPVAWRAALLKLAGLEP